MPSTFHDHHRKRIVREQWDTPTLEFLAGRWSTRYLYFGLPGPEALDVKLWKRLIQRVIAFELEDPAAANPRKKLVDLDRNLTLLGLPHAVYSGPLEEVVLEQEDRDGKPLVVDEFVTLFNLDFCNSITGKIPTQDGRKRLRFEVLREIVGFQRRLFRSTGTARFVILLAVHDSFNRDVMETFLATPDNREKTSSFVARVLRRDGALQGLDIHNTDLLRLFIFQCLREYFHGQNVKSVFLPVLSYVGKTAHSPMLHCVIVCEMEDQEVATVSDCQTLAEFLKLRVVKAVNAGLQPATDDQMSPSVEADPVAFLTKIGVG